MYAIEFERKFEAKGLHGYQPAAQTIPDAWDLFTSSPVVANGKLFFGSGDGNAYAIDARSGLLPWKFATEGVVHSSPAIVGHTLRVGSWDSRFYALDAETGQQKWVFQAGVDPAIHNQVGFQSSPAVVDGTVYIGCRDAHVYALDAANGKLAWEFRTEASKLDSLDVLNSDGSLRIEAFAPSFGDFQDIYLDLARCRSVGAIVSSPAVDGGVVYVGSMDGNLYALH